jgi:hypothetical protein
MQTMRPRIDPTLDRIGDGEEPQIFVYAAQSAPLYPKTPHHTIQQNNIHS